MFSLSIKHFLSYSRPSIEVHDRLNIKKTSFNGIYHDVYIIFLQVEKTPFVMKGRFVFTFLLHLITRGVFATTRNDV